MKRLFQVSQGGLNYFGTKAEAKAFRDAENAKLGKNVLKVSKGPDHIGNHGHSVPSTRHRAPKTAYVPGAKAL